MRSLRTLSLTTFLLCTILIAPALSSDNPRKGKAKGSDDTSYTPTVVLGGGWNTGSLCGGFELTLKGTCFATVDPNGWSVGVSDGKGERRFAPRNDAGTYLGVATIIAPEKPGRKDGKSRLNFYVPGRNGKNNKDCKCGAECDIIYSWLNTPTIEAIIPSAANAGSNVSFFGVQKVSDPSNIKYIKIGATNCFLPNNPNNPNEYDPNLNAFVTCTTPPNEPGFYNVTQRNGLNTGDAWIFDSVHIFRLNGDYYDFAVIPQITSISSRLGSYLGQIITITGSGFSSFATNDVQFADTDCVILSQSSTSIVCEVQRRDVIAVSNTVYHSGLKREQFTGTSHKTLGTPISTSSRLDGELLGNSGTFVAKLSGYFQAPVSGDYVFTLASGSKSYLYFNTIPGAAPSTLSSGTPIAQVGSSTPFRFPWVNSTKTVSDPVRGLQAGRFYYFEAYIENSGTEDLSIGVRIPGPAGGANRVNTFPDVQKIEATCTFQRLYTVIVVNSPGKGGFWYGKFTFTDGRYYTYSYSAQIPFGATAAQIQNALGYQTTVTVNDLQANLGIYTITISFNTFLGVVAFVPTINYNKPAGQSNSLSGRGASCQATTTINESPLLTGAFQIKDTNANSPTTEVNVRGNANDLSNALRNYGFSPLTRVYKTLHSDYYHSWVFALYNKNVPQLNVNAVDTSLTGCLGYDPASPNSGSDGISLGVYKIQQGSSDTYYDVIPNHLLRTAHSTSNAQITVAANGVIANCPGFNCDYAVTLDVCTVNPVKSTIVLSDLSSLELTIANLKRPYSLADFNKIRFAGNDCTGVSYSTLSSTSGRLKVNCPNPALGSYVPEIHINGFGYCAYQGVAINIIGSITGVTTGNGDSNIPGTGSEIVIIDGSGFPDGLDAAEDLGLEVIVGTADCSLISSTPTEITCLLGPQDAGYVGGQSAPVTIRVGGTSVNGSPLTIQPTTPVLTSVNPTKLNPVIQQDITLTGQNFDATKANTRVFLRNVATSVVSECDVKNPANPTTITCFYLGLRSGNYKIYAVTSLGKSNELDIQILVTVTSITPTSGSIEGGTTITIGGQIFSNERTQTLVYLGPENDYVLCDVISSSTNQVQCVTRPSVWGYTSQDLLVATRIQEESVCGISAGSGGCKFTFTTDATPRVTSCTPSGDFNPGATITYNTENFNVGAPTVTSGGIALTVTSWASGVLQVQIPNNFPPVINSSVDIFVSGKGYATFTTGTCRRDINVSLTLNTVSPNSGPTTGALLTLVGNGFTSSTQVNIGTTDVCQIRTVSSTQITCAAFSSGAITVIDPTYQTPISCSSGTCSIDVSTGAGPATPTISKSGNSLQVSSAGFTAGAQSLRMTSNRDSSVTFDKTGTLAGNTITFDITGVSAGDWKLEIASNTKIVTVSSWVFSPATSSSGTVSSSIAGGKSLTVTGNYFSTVASQNFVTVCGLPAKVTAATATSLTILTPAFTNSVVKTRFPRLTASDQLDGIWTGDVSSQVYKVNDNNEKTFYVSGSTTCSIQLDVGNGAVADLTEFRFVPAVGAASNGFNGMILEGSNDNLNWSPIYTFANTNDGYNFWSPSATQTFRYFRVRGNGKAGKCQFAEVQFFGILRSASSNDPSVNTNCPVVVNVNGASATSSLIVDYATSSTPVLYDFSPKYGTSIGGTVITLTGANFGLNPSVYIDDTLCTVPTGGASATQITCTTAAAPSIANRRNSIDSAITISFADGNAVTNRTAFFYVDLWSSVNTWSGITPPRPDDSVYIPPGQNVLVDVSPNPLKAVVIEGGLFFADGADINFDAKYIMVNGGRFQIGTAKSPVSSKVTVTLHGFRSDPSLPIAGNKMIANINGVIDIHGSEIVTPWTKLAATAASGSNTIVVTGDVHNDWHVGDHIVIASTEFDHKQAEEKIISSLSYSSGQTTIVLTTNLVNTHYALSQTVQGVSPVTFAAEVGLLTRNVVIQGDDSSDTSQHGVNIVSFSQGSGETVTRIANTEIYRCGQAYLVGRYAIYFRMIGSASKSYLSGNSIHNSYNRALSIHATHYLRVLNNVMYQIMGHAVYLEDGIETNNQISGNLVVSVRSSRALLLTDTIPSCFYITNPSNTFTNNACGGSDGQGFWFMLPQKTMGASYSNFVCPQGTPLGVFDSNSAHSNLENGLRIFPEWIPRTNPCSPWVDWTAETNPFGGNPAIPANLNNFVSWKNGINGIAAEKVGAILFNNPVVADNIRAGIEIADGRKADTGLLKVSDAIIIGRSDRAGTSSQYCVNGGARGLVLPRTDFFIASGVTFHNFQDCTTAVETCSRCENGPSSDSGARTSYLESIAYSGTVTQKLRFNTPRKDIVVDNDGTFTLTSAGASVTAFWEHLNDTTICPRNSAYDGIICNPTIKLRRVVFWGVGNVGSNDLKLLRVDSNTDLTEAQLVKSWRFSTIPYRYWRLPMGNYAFVAIVGYTYKYHWAYGVDFSNLYFLRGDTFEGQDFVNLVNNHTSARESYDVTNYRTNNDVLTIAQSAAGWYGDAVATAAKTNGDWFHDTQKNLFWTILKAGLNGTFFVQAYGCRLYCPRVVTYPVPPPDNVVKSWCNGPDWPNTNVPEDGASVVVIKSGWQMHLNGGCNTNNVKVVIVYGSLIVDDDADHALNLHAMWVLGSLTIGSAGTPYTHRVVINLYAGIDSSYLDYPVIDMNNALLVTGTLQIYASPPSILSSVLTSPVAPPTGRLLPASPYYQITIEDDVTGIWMMGDQIVIESTEATGKSEVFTIAEAPNGNIISLLANPTLTHHGAASAITLPGGATIENRARVGLISRNVQIIGNPDDSWGCRIHVAEYGNQKGRAYMDGVQITRCGQAPTGASAVTFDTVQLTGSTPSFIKRSAIHDSWSNAVVISGSNLVDIQDNIFARAVGSGLILSGTLNRVNIKNNWITGVGTRTSSNPDFMYTNWDASFRADGARIIGGTVENNKITDCAGTCASIAGGDCDYAGPWTYQNNLIYNGANGLTVSSSSSTCTGASKWTIASIQGTAVAAAANAVNVIIEDFHVVDATFGFSVNTGGQENVTITIQNSYIGGAMNDETYYSSRGISCSGRTGIVASTSSNRAKTLPIWGPTSPWRRQFLEGAWQTIVRITGNYFYNWKANTDTICQNNYIITNNDLAPNSQAVHLFYGNNIVGSSVDSNHFVMIVPHEKNDNLVKRCGGWECTGYNNTIFKDVDGSLTGVTQGLTAFPYLENVAQPYCTQILHYSSGLPVGYRCQGKDWGLLAIESLDLDRETRIFSPVNVTRTDGSFRNDLNAMMAQDDNYVENWVRLARFYSVIQTNKNYLVSYLGSLPNQMRFQLQGASSDDDWVIVKQRYDQPYIISVAFHSNNSVIRSGIKGPDNVADLSASGCGGNYYYGVDQIVEFKLTGRYDCILVATVTNGVKGRVRYAIDVNSFYANDGPTQFIDRVANVLGIDLNTVRVVSVVRGSTVLDFTIATPTQGAPTNDAQQQQINSEISSTIDKLQQAIASGQLNILGSTILDSSFSGSSASNPTGASSSSSSAIDSKIIIIAAALGGLVLIIAAILIVKRMKNKDENKTKVPGKFFDVKKGGKSPIKIGTRVFPLPKDLTTPSEKAPVITDLESMTSVPDKSAPKVGSSTELSMRKLIGSDGVISPSMSQINFEAHSPTKSRQQLKNPFE